MSIELGSAYVSILPDMGKFKRQLTTGMDKEMGKAGSESGTKFGKGMEDGAKKGSGKMKSIFKGALKGAGVAALATGAGIAIAKPFIDAASAAEQSIGATEALFGKYSDTVIKKSKEAAQEYGLSANEYRDSSNLLAALFKNQGVEMDQLAGKTDQMVGLGADLAAMYGGTTADAVEAMTAAYKGEFNSLEKYGITMKASTVNAEAMAVANVDSAKAWNALSTEEQAAATQQATTNLLMKQSADAQGQAARESDTYAGQMQRLQASLANTKETLGTALLPIVSSFVGVLNKKVVPAISGFISGMKDGSGWGGKLSDTFSAVKGVVVPVFDEIKGGIEAFGAAWKYNDGEVTSSGLPGVMERIGYWARQAFDYVKLNVIPGIQNLVAGFQNGEGAGGKLRTAFENIRNAAVAVFGWFRDEALPVLKTLGDFILNTLWPDIKRAFIDRIMPAVTEVGKTISWMWTNFAQPALKALWTFIKTILLPFIIDFYQNGIKPTFDLIGKVISFAWKNVIKPLLEAWVNFVMKTLAPGIADFATKAKDSFVSVRDRISSVWTTVKGVFDKFKAGVAAVKDAFTSAKDGIAKVWGTLGAAIAKPINTVIGTVNNFLEKLRKGLNAIPGVDLKGNWGNIPTVPVPAGLTSSASTVARGGGGTRAAYLAAGGFVPGWSPNDKADNIPAWLTAGEYVLPVKATERLRSMLGDEGLETLRRGNVPHYADGGSVGSAIVNGGKWLMQRTGADRLTDFLADSVNWVKKVWNHLMPDLSGSWPAQVAKGAMSKISMKNVADAVMKRVMPEGGNGRGGVHYPGGYGQHPTGMPWQRIWAMIKSVVPNAIMTSNFRGGARTADGIPSLHGLGRAVDWATPGMRGMVEAFRKVGKIMPWSQHFYTPAGAGSQHGYTSAAIRAMHYDHGHTALAYGGLVPNLYDRGGLLQPGVSLVSNQTNKPEMVLTEDQFTAMGQSGNTIVINGVKMDNTTEVADELLFAMKRTRRGKYNRVR